MRQKCLVTKKARFGRRSSSFIKSGAEYRRQRPARKRRGRKTLPTLQRRPTQNRYSGPRRGCDDEQAAGTEVLRVASDGVTTAEVESAASSTLMQAAAASTALQFHPFAEIFPLLEDDRLNELVQDIKEHGLLDAHSAL